MQLDRSGTILIKVEPEDLNENGTLVVPEQISQIGGWALSGCSQLTQVILPNGLTHIREHAFDDCINLKQITLPDTLTDIGDNAFSGCWNLEQITFPQQLTYIGKNAFMGCHNLTQIELPSDLKELQLRVFSACTSLRQVKLPKNLIKIGDEAFYNCAQLVNIILPNTLTYLEDGAFGHCQALTQITLPHGLTYIGIQAFQFCRGLTHISLPDGLTYIGEGLFDSCDNLTQISFPGRFTHRKQSGIFNYKKEFAMNLKKNSLIAIRTTDPQRFEHVKSLIKDISKYQVLEVEIMDRILSIQQQAFHHLLQHHRSSMLYPYKKNHFISRLPSEMRIEIDHYLLNENPYARKLQWQIEKIRLPKSAEDIERYEKDVKQIVVTFIKKAKMIWAPIQSKDNTEQGSNKGVTEQESNARHFGQIISDTIAISLQSFYQPFFQPQSPEEVDEKKDENEDIEKPAPT